MFPEFFEFFNPTRVVFSPGIVSDFKAELDAIGIKRYFLISDRGVNGAGILDRVKKGLKYAEVQIIGEYFDVSQDAELDGIKSCAA
ncbi:MAG TPA: iron-containing alcohol dehydrogenase [bacterium]|nr:iron-containing alcohol dehydrogenase [bacterium]